MPTNRSRRTRNRRPVISSDIEHFFVTGRYEHHCEHLFEIFAGDPLLYEIWDSCKARLMRKHKRCIAAQVFEAGGKLDHFTCSTGLSRSGYEKWKAASQFGRDR